VNTYKTQWTLEKIKNTALAFEKDRPTKAKVACMGLAFKPDIDDLRESPALLITQSLVDEGIDVLAVEPNIKFYDGLTLVNYQDAIREADIVVFLVAHKEFRGLKVMNALDFCGVLA
jgi:UDP-N-acetyl-D-mannosaminuronic acid dehydrogenase